MTTKSASFVPFPTITDEMVRNWRDQTWKAHIKYVQGRIKGSRVSLTNELVSLQQAVWKKEMVVSHDETCQLENMQLAVDSLLGHCVGQSRFELSMSFDWFNESVCLVARAATATATA